MLTMFLVLLLVGQHAVHAKNTAHLPECECVNFVDGLTTDDIGKTACARDVANGILGAQTVCSPTTGTYHPFLSDGCPSDHYRCVVSYMPPKFPACGCSSYSNLNPNGPVGSSAAQISQTLADKFQELSQPPAGSSAEASSARVVAASGVVPYEFVGPFGPTDFEGSKGATTIVARDETAADQPDGLRGGYAGTKVARDGSFVLLGTFENSRGEGVVAEVDPPPLFIDGDFDAAGRVDLQPGESNGAAVAAGGGRYSLTSPFDDTEGASAEAVAAASVLPSDQAGAGGAFATGEGSKSVTVVAGGEAKGSVVSTTAVATARGDLPGIAADARTAFFPNPSSGLESVRPSQKSGGPLVGLCEKKAEHGAEGGEGGVCFPTYKFEKDVGNVEYYGCPQDTHRCDVPQALSFKEVTTCKGGDISAFSVSSKLSLVGYSDKGAPEYAAIESSFTAVGYFDEPEESDTEVTGFIDGKAITLRTSDDAAAIAFCSSTNYFLPLSQLGMKLYYDDHLCDGRQGWALDIPALSALVDKDDGTCVRKNAEFVTDAWPMPPIDTKHDWDAGYPFVCDGADFGIRPFEPPCVGKEFAVSNCRNQGETGGTISGTLDLTKRDDAGNVIDGEIVLPGRSASPKRAMREITLSPLSATFKSPCARRRRLDPTAEKGEAAAKLAKVKELLKRCAGGE